MAQLNTWSPSQTVGKLVICDFTQIQLTQIGGSVDGITGQTLVNGVPVSSALEVNSTKGAFLPPRMTTPQRNAMIVTNGMQIYNITQDTMQMRIAGAWSDINPGGSVDGPAVSAIPNVSVFNNLTGSLIADSGIRLFGATTNSLYLGQNVGNLAATGLYNTCLGTGAGANITTASENVFIGRNSGSVNLDYTQCTLIGNGTETSIGNLVNATAIGYLAQVGGSNCLVLGKGGTNVGIGIVVPSASLHIQASPGVYGGVILPTRTTGSDDFALDFTDYIVYTNALDDIQVTLPITNASHAGQILIVKTASVLASSITITAQAGQQIDFDGSSRIFSNTSSANTGIGITLQTDGANWFIHSLVGTV
jgi:hypothetical protein